MYTWTVHSWTTQCHVFLCRSGIHQLKIGLIRTELPCSCVSMRLGKHAKSECVIVHD